MTDSKTIENVVIIGGGPAGLSASIYLARANVNPVVFAGSPPGGQLTLTTEVENFPGHLSIIGPELVQKMREQAVHFNTRIIDQNIKSINLKNRPFEIVPAPKDSQSIYAKAVIIATGAKALWLGLSNEERLRGKGVSACATCDGFFFRNKTVAVVGGGDTAMEEAMVLSRFANKIYLIHRRSEFRASKIMQDRVKENKKITILWNTAIIDVLGDEKVNGIHIKETENGKESDIQVDGLFLAIGHKPDTELFHGQIELDSKGYIMTNARLAEDYLRGKTTVTEERGDSIKGGHYFSTATSIEGVFAGGDCVDSVYRQAITASGMGVAASLDVERWLEGQ